MRRFFILLLVILMPLKALAVSYGVCNQGIATQEQQHATQSNHAHHGYDNIKSQIETKHECAHCTLCHTACSAFVISFNNGFMLPTVTSQTMAIDLTVQLKTQPSDPPYRPKWLALA